jgi:hypothetical protein
MKHMRMHQTTCNEVKLKDEAWLHANTDLGCLIREMKGMMGVGVNTQFLL